MGFLDALGADTLAALRRLGNQRRYRKGMTIFNDGDSSDSVVIVVAGHVKLCQFDDRGTETLLAISGPNEIVGELAATAGGPRSATAIALDVVDALVLPGTSFRSFVADHSDAALALVRIMTERLRLSNAKVAEFARLDTLGRVARRLAQLAESYGVEEDGAIRITLALTQEELAGLTASSRESVVKALKLLRDQGAIETGRRLILVLDLDRLHKLASA
jgi:CRP/FNR family transcriptional regulator, cyclic AMP receptor protein